MSQQMKAEIVAEVQAGLADRIPAERPTRMGVSVVPAVVLAFVPQVVQTGIDMVLQVVLQAVGQPLEALTQSEKDRIRQFVSNSTLNYLDGLIRGLEDVPSDQ